MNSKTITIPIPRMTSNVPPVQLSLLILLVVMGLVLSIYGIRIQVKLAGVLIDIISLTLFLIKDKYVLNLKERIQMILTIVLILIIGMTICRLMIVDGPQPVTPKNYIPPSKVEVKKGLVDYNDNSNNVPGRVSLER